MDPTVPVEEAALGAVVSQLSRRILEKLERGKKLSTEDLLLLYLDLQYRELSELNKKLDNVYRELLARIDGAEGSLRGEIRETAASLEACMARLETRLDETSKRIDKVLEALAVPRSGEHR